MRLTSFSFASSTFLIAFSWFAFLRERKERKNGKQRKEEKEGETNKRMSLGLMMRFTAANLRVLRCPELDPPLPIVAVEGGGSGKRG